MLSSLSDSESDLDDSSDESGSSRLTGMGAGAKPLDPLEQIFATRMAHFFGHSTVLTNLVSTWQLGSVVSLPKIETRSNFPILLKHEYFSPNPWLELLILCIWAPVHWMESHFADCSSIFFRWYRLECHVKVRAKLLVTNSAGVWGLSTGKSWLVTVRNNFLTS